MSKISIFVKGAIGSLSSQIFTVVLSIVSVPIALNYLGSFQYGIWVVISSIILYLALSQFGLSTSSSVLIAKTAVRADQGLIFKRTFSLLTYFSLLSLFILGVLSFFSESWGKVFGEISRFSRHDAVSATIIMVAFYILRIPAIAFTSTFFGLQEVYLERIYVVVVPAFLSFLALLITIFLGGHLLMLATLTGSAQLLASIVSGIHFSMRHGDMLSIKKNVTANNDLTKDLLSSGSRIFFIGLASMVVWSTDSLVISYFLGPELVTSYAVTFKLYAAAFAMLSIGNSVLMPMFGSAFGRGEWSWIREVYQNSLPLMVVLGGLVWVGGILFSKPIILLFIGLQGYGGPLVVFALGGYGYILSSINLTAHLLSGINATRFMLWIAIAEATLNLALSIIFIRWWGVGGVALGTFMSALLTVYWLLPLDLKKQTFSNVKLAWRPVLNHFFFAVLPLASSV